MTLNESKVVYSRWTRSPAFYGTIAIICVVVLAALPGYISVWGTLPPWWETALILGGGFAGILLVLVLSAFYYLVRWAELSMAGVTFVEGKRRVSVDWIDLVPPHNYSHFFMAFRYRKDGLIVKADGLIVTPSLAASILSFPDCPKYHLTQAVSKGLGLLPR